jgi:2-polyprenyl-3-methyl-5-hydroxy-6-metoxy-1,4-benzoquinol methylase
MGRIPVDPARVINTMFESCEICGSREWKTVYEGSVRDGAFGNLRQGATVARCEKCGADRLAEKYCLIESAYENDSYRTHLQQNMDAASFLAAHDEMQLFSLQSLWPMPLRRLSLADVGCAGGSFLDHVRGLASRIVAVEPCTLYHKSLADRGYEVFEYADVAVQKIGPVVDLAVSLQVIEHTRDPHAFLADIRLLLKPGGCLLISTPNRDDFLMNALPETYRQFFYRIAHRWYFDANSLKNCAERAGFAIDKIKYVHRYSLSNAFLWLRDRCPSGHSEIQGLAGLGDNMWRTFLEATGQSDCIYMLLRNPEATE